MYTSILVLIGFTSSDQWWICKKTHWVFFLKSIYFKMWWIKFGCYVSSVNRNSFPFNLVKKPLWMDQIALRNSSNKSATATFFLIFSTKSLDYYFYKRKSIVLRKIYPHLIDFETLHDDHLKSHFHNKLLKLF